MFDWPDCSRPFPSDYRPDGHASHPRNSTLTRDKNPVPGIGDRAAREFVILDHSGFPFPSMGSVLTVAVDYWGAGAANGLGLERPEPLFPTTCPLCDALAATGDGKFSDFQAGSLVGISEAT